MSIRTEAEENLRIIRSLMEKATVYRAISAPGALIGGICAVATAVGGRLLEQPWRTIEVDPATGAAETVLEPTFLFLAPWFGVLTIAVVANFFLLARGARLRGESFLSPGMRLALRAMLPALLGGGVVTMLILPFGPASVASLWVLFYGISLLAASHFAPKSICWLGRAFFVAGVALVGGGVFLLADADRGSHWIAAQDIMGGTFGLFHLIYAACIWPRGVVARAEA